MVPHFVKPSIIYIIRDRGEPLMVSVVMKKTVLAPFHPHISQMSSDWLFFTNKRFELQVGALCSQTELCALHDLLRNISNIYD